MMGPGGPLDGRQGPSMLFTLWLKVKLVSNMAAARICPLPLKPAAWDPLGLTRTNPGGGSHSR